MRASRGLVRLVLCSAACFRELSAFTARHQQQHCPTSSSIYYIQSTTTLWSSSTADFGYLETVREGLVEAGLEDDWNTAAAYLSDAVPGVNLSQAQDSLAKAWKWRSWAVVKSPMARKFIKTVPPNVAQIQTAVAWLREGPLAVPDEVLARGVRENPEVYLLEPETLYGQALHVAPQEYRDPETFRETLLRAPSVLGCTYNCVDTGCNSDCGSCWVSFKTVLKQSSKSSGEW